MGEYQRELSDEFSLEGDHKNKIRSKPDGASELQKTQIISYWDAFSFGICLTTANLVYAWPGGLYLGFWTFFAAYVISSLSFISLHLCLAEMISILPFSGGSYAFARVTVGPYIGFLVGCFECLGNMIYSMIGMIPLGSYITYMIGGNKRWEPLYWLAIYVVMLLNEFSGRRRYFHLMRVVAFLLVMTLVFYIIISIPNSNSKKYLPEDSIDLMFQGGATEFLTAFPFSSFFFFGMEIIPLISDEVKDTRKHTPAAIVSTIFFVSIFSSLLLFFVYSQYPSYPRGDQKFSQNHLLALNTGFINGFGISDRVATLFSYPALVISNCICIYGFAKQMKALSDSRLFPSVLGKTFSGTKIPYNSLLLGCTLSYLILLIALAYDQVDVYSPIIFNTYCFGLLGTYFAYIILFISYMIFKRKYSTLPRVYVNRLGLGSAIYGIILLIVQFMIVCFSSSSFTSLQIFILFVFFLSLYYYFYARYRQTFSEEEQKILFVVYLLKANEKKKGSFLLPSLRNFITGLIPTNKLLHRFHGPSRKQHLQKVLPISVRKSSVSTFKECSVSDTRVSRNQEYPSHPLDQQTIIESLKEFDSNEDNRIESDSERYPNHPSSMVYPE